MEITEYIQTRTIEALLDDRQDRIDGLLHAAQLACGALCPAGHPESEINILNGGEAYCAACDDVYRPVQAAVEALYEAGYDDIYAE